MTLQQSGNVAAANMLGQFAGAVVSLLLLRRVKVRYLLLAGIVLLPTGDLVSAALVTNPTALAIARMLAGFGAGLTLACGFATVAALPNPARVFAAVLFLQTLSGAAALLVAPGLFAAIGIRGAFIGLAAVALTSLAFLPFFAQPATDTIGQRARQALPQVATALVLGSLFVHYIANNGIWAHFDRIGAAAGLSKENVGLALSIGQLCSLVGAAGAALLSTRVNSRAAILAGIAAIALSTAMLLRVANTGYLLASVALFIGSIGFVVPFYLASLAARDATGRSVIMGKLSILGGLVVGPALAAAIATATSLTVMILFSMALFVLALVLAGTGLQDTRRLTSTEGAAS
jgi:MFS family permease